MRVAAGGGSDMGVHVLDVLVGHQVSHVLTRAQGGNAHSALSG